MLEGYRVKAKIAVGRFKWFCFRLFLFLLGVMVGVSFLIAYKAYGEAVEPITYVNIPLTVEKPVVVKNEAKNETLSVEERIEAVAREMGFEDSEFLVRLAFCESSLNPYAKNVNSSARGLFQIMDMHGLSEDERYNIEKSTAWTIEKLRKDGTNPWQSSQHCWSK